MEGNLYRFLKKYPTAIATDDRDNPKPFVSIPHEALNYFMETSGYRDYLGSRHDGRIDVSLGGSSVLIPLEGMLMGKDMKISCYKDCFDRAEWDHGFSAQTCCKCNQTCYEVDGGGTGIAYSGTDYDNLNICTTRYVCENCAEEFEAHSGVAGDGFRKKTLKDTRLFKFLMRHKTELQENPDPDGSPIPYVLVPFDQAAEFSNAVKSVGNNAMDNMTEGFQASFCDTAFRVNLDGILAARKELLVDYKDCFSQAEWDYCFMAHHCFNCGEDCYEREGGGPQVVYSGINHDDEDEGKTQYICQDCSIDFEEYGMGFVRRLVCDKCHCDGLTSKTAFFLKDEDGCPATLCKECYALCIKEKDGD